MKPFRLIVQENLSLALQEITPANGYLNDLSGKVFRGRIIFGEDDPLPMISILEPPLPDDPLDMVDFGTDQVNSYVLLIQGFIKDDPFNPTDPAQGLLADIKRRLTIERKKRQHPQGPLLFGTESYDPSNIYDLAIGAGGTRPPDDVSAVAYCWLSITLSLMEDLENPYY